MEIKRVGVVGAGTMGNGIAQVFAQSGFDVVLSDVTDAILDRAVALIGGSMDRMIKKEKMTAAEKDAALKRITKTTNLKAMADCDIIIEAIIEDFAAKQKMFAELDRLAKACAILATNTSAISITRIAACTKRPAEVIGMHFMNPVPMMALVEIVRGIATSDETYRSTEDLAKKLGKTPVEVNDYPGFVSNRVLMPMINEACYTLMEGVATKEAIDTVMKLGMAHPMGPLALADLIGLDICLSIMEVLYEGFSDSKYRPCPLLRKMVTAGYLGRKTKRGFYTYE
ncbi:MAG TPA: 3-hydroxybutyryl-CoA dehydrogenase [bacterium]|nr:3-hydroxybutyryl-CoA dehydrogenase [bacterium]